MIAPTGLTTAELKSHPEGITLLLEMHYQKYRQQGFATPSKKLEIFSERFQKSGYAPVPEFEMEEPADRRYPLRLTSAKWVAYCHSQQRHLPSLRKRIPEPLVELNPETASSYGIAENEWVLITTHEGAIQARAKFNKSLADDVICSQYGWWDNAQGIRLNYNNIISDSDFDPISSSNTLRNFRCTISKVDG